MDALREYMDSVFDSAEMSEETRKLLKPLRLSEWDRLKIALTAEGELDCVVYSADPQRMASFSAVSGWAARIPETRLVGHCRFIFAPTDFSVIVIRSLWGSRVTFVTQEAEAVYMSLLLRLVDQASASATRAAFKLQGKQVEPPDGWLDHPDFPLSPYQLVSAVTAMDQEAQALFLDPGLGKTAIAISRIMNEARRMREADPNSLYTCLVVCPRNCRYNWENEIRRFATTCGQVVTLRGDKMERVKTLTAAMNPVDPEAEWSVVVCSYDIVRKTWAAFSMIPWDLAILDESHYIKGQYTARSETFLKLRHRCRQRMILTGTPIGNSILDLWGQFEFLGEGLSGFTNWKAFRDYYCVQEKNWGGPQGSLKTIGYTNLPLLRERMSRLASIFTKEEVLKDLAPKVYDVCEVAMTAKQAEIYNKLSTQLAYEIEQGGELKTVTANHVLTKLLRLAQITSGFVSYDNPNGSKTRIIERFPENPKLEELKSIWAEMQQNEPGNKMIVWCHFIPDIRLIAETFGDIAVQLHGQQSDDERTEAQRRFNEDDTCKIIVGNPIAGGVGVNLRGYDLKKPGTTYASRTVYYSQGWSSLVRRQSEDRNHGRERCRGQVRYTDLIVPGSIDEQIRLHVMAKTENALSVQDVREILAKVLGWKAKAEA